MADEDMKKILENLQLNELINIFERNEITKEVLKDLNEDMINELIPIIGKRAKFLSFWKQYKSNISEEVLMNNEDNTCINKKRKLADDVNISLLDYNNQLETKNLSFPNSTVTEQLLISIKTMLNGSKLGQQILTYYSTKNELCEKLRRNLCEIIISHIDNLSLRMTNDLAEYVSAMIIETFPNEVKETYYTSPITKKNSVTNKLIPSRGKLMTMWRNKQHKTKILDKKIQEEKELLEISAVTEENDENELLEENVQWLKYNQAPWELVVENWNKCYTIRFKDLKQCEDKNLSKIFEKWPLYKYPQGYELIALDFKSMNISEINLNYDMWLNFFEIVKRYTDINHKNNNLNLMLQQIEDKEVNKDAKTAIILQLLPHFIPPKRVFVSGKNSYKASIGAAKDSMIKHFNVPGDMLRVRYETKKNAETLKTPVQPYIITVGDYKTNIDTLFMLFIKYPAASEHLWMLIQRGIYGFTTKSDLNIPFTAYILKKLLDGRTEILTKQIANESIENTN